MNEQFQACRNKSETFKSRKTVRTVGESLKDVFMLNGESEGGVTQICKSVHKDNLIKVPEHSESKTITDGKDGPAPYKNTANLSSTADYKSTLKKTQFTGQNRFHLSQVRRRNKCFLCEAEEVTLVRDVLIFHCPWCQSYNSYNCQGPCRWSSYTS